MMDWLIIAGVGYLAIGLACAARISHAVDEQCREAGEVIGDRLYLYRFLAWQTLVWLPSLVWFALTRRARRDNG